MAVKPLPTAPAKPVNNPTLDRISEDSYTIVSHQPVDQNDLKREFFPKTLYLICNFKEGPSHKKPSFQTRDLTLLANQGTLGIVVAKTVERVKGLARKLILSYPENEAIDQVIIDFDMWTKDGLHLSDASLEEKYITCEDLLLLLAPSISSRCTFIFRGVFKDDVLDSVKRCLKTTFPQSCSLVINAPADEVLLQTNPNGIVESLTHLPSHPDPVEDLTQSLANCSLSPPYDASLAWGKNITKVEQAFEEHNIKALQRYQPRLCSTLVLLAPYKKPRNTTNPIIETWEIIKALSSQGNVFCLLVRRSEEIEQFAKAITEQTGCPFHQIVLKAETNHECFLLSEAKLSNSLNFMSPSNFAMALGDNIDRNCALVLPTPSSSVSCCFMRANIYTPSCPNEQMQFVTNPEGKIKNVSFLAQGRDITARPVMDPLALRNATFQHLSTAKRDLSACLDSDVANSMQFALKKGRVYRQFQVINATSLMMFNPNLPTTVYILADFDKAGSPAFYDQESFQEYWNFITRLSSKGNVFCDIATKVEDISLLLRKIHTLTQGKGIAQLIVCGHGGPKGTAIFLTDKAGKQAYITEMNFISHIYPFLSKKPTVLFDSCSTGGPYRNALASILNKRLPQIRFFAPRHKTSGTEIDLNETGMILNVKFIAAEKLDLDQMVYYV